MTLQRHKSLWDALACTDPMWAILTTDEKRDRKWDEQEFFGTGKKEIADLLAECEALGISPLRNRVLDFGCGIGRLTQALAEYFAESTGVDVSDAMIAEARRINCFGERCTYLVNNAPDLAQLSVNAFDLVYSNIVLQHIVPDISRQYIHEFFRVARPGGVIIFQLPSSIHWRRRIQWRRHLFQFLQSAGVSGEFMIRRLRINPMRMAFLPRPVVETVIAQSGGTVVSVKEWTAMQITSCLYFAIKRDPASAS